MALHAHAQVAVPVTLIASTLILGRRYTLKHYMAAAAVCFGVLAAFIPVASASHASAPLASVLLLLVSRVPQVCASIRVECLLASSHVSHQAGEVGVLRVALVTGALALVFNLPAAFGAVAFTKHGSPAQHLLGDYTDGARCLFLRSATAHAGRCTSAWHAVLAFSLPGVAFALSQFMVLKYASASTYFLLLGLELPVS